MNLKVIEDMYERATTRVNSVCGEMKEFSVKSKCAPEFSVEPILVLLGNE